ncbi:unnamed protein product [Didymodactylos carnosus]|uniref:LamG-like jellyroll fold domain-containing protein n=1 Tax=Didymodactylos carnosus TaxID=1234261 RepID=A0A815J6B8_9BILA|nr:unnamed protein product [Didymodactylos carnosus]CAF4269847.1 unnamed protein product [Didymodactylos carnosus]
MNSPTYVSPGYTGYGSKIYFQGTLNQSVRVTYPVLNLAYTSLSIEAWIYPFNVSTNADDSIFSQCQALATDQCLHFVLASGYLRMRFYNDGSQGVTLFQPNRWYHIACVYDYTLTAQIVYVNGVLDGSYSPSGPYQGTSGLFEIGIATVNYNIVTQPFNGYMDQVLFTPRAKNATEILNDATLTAYYSFDGGLYLDSGPLWINGTGVSVNRTTGRVNQALSFATSSSYFQATGFTLLGTVNQSFSIALWIKPTTVSGGATIVHTSGLTTRTGWCIPMIGLSSSGNVITQNWNNGLVSVTGPVLSVNVWTHIVETYSFTNGVRMYVNGALYGATTSFSYYASGTPNTITLGNPLSGSACASSPVLPGQFYGAMDEFRLYSRELNSTDVYSLAHP